jgi:hypothetical protein
MVRYKPTAYQCMLLFLLAIQEAERRLGKSLRLVRLPRATLRRLWIRQRLSEDFLAEVEEWLLSAGWALVDAGSGFAAIKTAAVKNWPRLSANNLSSELEKVQSGRFKFDELEMSVREADDDSEDANE